MCAPGNRPARESTRRRRRRLGSAQPVPPQLVEEGHAAEAQTAGGLGLIAVRLGEGRNQQVAFEAGDAGLQVVVGRVLGVRWWGVDIGERVFVDVRARGEGHETLDDVFEFAHVARETSLPQAVDDPRGEPHRTDAVTFPETVGEVLGERGDVLGGALAAAGRGG